MLQLYRLLLRWQLLIIFDAQITRQDLLVCCELEVVALEVGVGVVVDGYARHDCGCGGVEVS